jgi:hypothetical protein
MAGEKTGGIGLLIAAILIVAALFGLGGVVFSTSDSEGNPPPVGRTDVLFIDTPAELGELERPPAVFLHARHTDALAGEDGRTDCTLCHLRREDGRLSVLFQRLEAVEDRDRLVAIYHDGCIGCHEQRGGSAAPRAEACGACHVEKPRFVSDRVPAGYDLSLHQRHVADYPDDCGRCHHRWDPQRQQLVYVKGAEESCRACHRSQRQGKVASFRVAAHEQCVGCHLTHFKGPTTCSGCHDAAERATILVLDKVPRLDRGQPDWTLVHAAAEDLPQMKMATVPFDHRLHETATPTCRACHHESLAACKQCHTLAGAKEGGGVPLRTAYHNRKSRHACVGCHEAREAANRECAGCHALMPDRALDDRYCDRCHRGPLPERVAAADGDLIRDYEQQPVLAPSHFAASDVPDSVTVDHLVDEYEAATMPHGKIIERLSTAVAANPLARRFHGEADRLCQGCHHHSPAGQRPPLCSSCHGEPFQANNLQSPGLYGALHQQCIGCHQVMALRTDCTVCHAKRQTELASDR